VSDVPQELAGTFTTESEAQTIDLARQLASRVTIGTVVTLEGQLGTGKTTFVRGLVAGLGGDPADVTSPTFTLIQSYSGPMPLHHVDLYRLTGAEADDLGLEELATDGVVAIEWPERLIRPIPGAIHVRIDDGGGERREITIAPAAGEGGAIPAGSSALPL
jgi:tRNA threonylcarbamoyl adenosine modification protein YjeE